MSLFKFFSCCLPSRQSRRNPVLDSPTSKIRDVFLMDMPDLVMREILKNLDFLSIQQLRKTCYSLREFIDYVKVDSGLKDFEIEITRGTILGSATVLMKGYPSSETIKSAYIESEDWCEVITSNGNILKINGNFVDVYSEDFLTPMLKNQKSLLTTLKWGRGDTLVPGLFEKVFDCLIKVLKLKDHLLQIEDLEIYVLGQDQLMQLLYHIDLKSLKRLEVRRLVENDPKDNDELWLDLRILERAENLIELRVINFTIFSSLRCIAHVPKLRVDMLTIHCDDVLKYHETLRTSNFLPKSSVYYQHFPDKRRFKNTLGPSDRRFYYPISGTILLSHYPSSKRMFWGPIH
ncbi:hypothetical protein GCK72_021422 [Caenorhabditis remanei]|uniref:F-box domain-containing protein n=1 Tax=Caenorhabditis remanei TaxID=31234 RepID=A0A6A5GI41_CAERE|nr:hypothetical protein GCK72_021422 [Caenorhabditis remanei]KAF1754857.1 hypothetical protein GCK72_021422 [Caenorhabditis remanei]